MLRLLSSRAKAAFATKYSRQFLDDLAVDREAIARAEREQRERVRVQSIFELPANSRNPANFVKVRVNHPLL